MKLPALEYASPRSIQEVIALLQRHEDAKILSGGQSLMPMLAFRIASCSMLIDLKHVPDLDYIRISQTGVEIGAKVRWRDIEHNRALQQAHPLLAAAVGHIAHYQIRNRGTVGGSLAHADPAAELPCIALTCDAQIIAAGPNGSRSIQAADFFISPLVTVLKADEMIVGLSLPPWPRKRCFAFEEFARRRGDFALAGAAVFYDKGSDGRICNARVGAFGVADTPLRLRRAEEELAGASPDEEAFARAARVGTQDLELRSDIHADSDYRRALLETLIKRALTAAARREQA